MEAEINKIEENLKTLNIKVEKEIISSFGSLDIIKNAPLIANLLN